MHASSVQKFKILHLVRRGYGRKMACKLSELTFAYVSFHIQAQRLETIPTARSTVPGLVITWFLLNQASAYANGIASKTGSL